MPPTAGRRWSHAGPLGGKLGRRSPDGGRLSALKRIRVRPHSARAISLFPAISEGRFSYELKAARALTGRPVAVNVLLPFARRDWFAAAASADAIVTFWGTAKRRTPGVWLHQCGSVAEAMSAQAAGADGVIVQGVEAGGHVRGTMPALDLLQRVRAELPLDYPLLLAGGIADSDDTRQALDAGAEGAVAGIS